MVQGFLILVGLLIVGNALSNIFTLPIPGSVIGMLMLFFGLCLYKSVPEDLGKVSDGLVAHIGLLFVPAGAGISLYLSMITENWVVILSASAISTFLTLIFSVLVFRVLQKYKVQND
ncbi:MAG: CidA/LrgA family protein [Bdellovibrionales bacterium]